MRIIIFGSPDWLYSGVVPAMASTSLSVVYPLTEWVVIIRHPVVGCVSLYEKAGGLPEDGLFLTRARSVMSPFSVAE
ncbi:MAG: hypothetical protein ACYDDP_07900 [Acidithiobacillus sp.]